MKKLLFIFVMCLIIMGCTSNNENPIYYGQNNRNTIRCVQNNKSIINQNLYKKYEVLLSTKDTIYIEAYKYWWSFDNTTYSFEDNNKHTIMIIKNPVYIKEIK